MCGDYNGIISKILGDGWVNPRILSVQSLEAHHWLTISSAISVILVCHLKAVYILCSYGFSACPPMQSMVIDLLEKEKIVILSDFPIPGMSEGITQVIMEEVHLDHEQ